MDAVIFLIYKLRMLLQTSVCQYGGPQAREDSAIYIQRVFRGGQGHVRVVSGYGAEDFAGGLVPDNDDHFPLW